MKDGNKLGRLIKLIHLNFENNKNTFYTQYDVTSSQMDLLIFLDEQDQKEASQKAIVEYLQISYATVSGLLKRLEAKQYIERVELSSDRRASLIRLTPAGKELFNTCHLFLEAQDQWLTRDFTDEEEKMLVHLLNRLLKNAAVDEESIS